MYSKEVGVRYCECTLGFRLSIAGRSEGGGCSRASPLPMTALD